MRLMAAQAIDLCPQLRHVGRIGQIRDRMSVHRMYAPEFQRQDYDLVLGEVILGELDLAVEDREQVIGLKLLRLRIRSMALEAQRIRGLGAQQVIVFTAVRLMARGTSLLECRLMQRVLLSLLGLIAVASQADIDRVGLGQSRLPARVWIVAVGAISRGSRVRHLRLVDGLGFLRVVRFSPKALPNLPEGRIVREIRNPR